MAKINGFLNKIRTAIHGKDVRGSLADGLEEVNKETEIATEVSVNTERRQGILEQQFDDVLTEWSDDRPVDNAETIASRTNRETGVNYPSLTVRLDRENKDVSAQLTRNTNDIGDPNEFRFNDPDLITKMRNEFGDRGYNIRWNALLALDGDWTGAIKAAVNACPIGSQVLVPDGQYRTTEEVVVDKNIDFIMLGTIVSDHDGNGIVFDGIGRGDGSTPHLRVKVMKKNRRHDLENGGVVLKNCYHAKILIDYVEDFTFGALFTSGEGKGTVYNEISIGQIKNSKKQIYITNYDETGWTNQNTFTGGRLYYSLLENREDYVQVEIDDKLYSNNGNVFLNISLEDIGVNGNYAKATIIGGHSNHFIAPRTEGSLDWLFTKSSFKNRLDGGTYTSMSRITDLGSFNQFSTQGSGSYQSTQVPGYSHKFVAGANNTVGLEATGDGPNRIPARFWNEGASGYPAMQIMERDGETVAGEFRANGAWIVRGGNRSVFWGVHLGAPTSGSYNKGDLSFITNPGLGDPIGYVCVTSGSPGTWRAFGQIGAKSSITSTPDYAGQTAVVSGVGYMATGTTSPSDWKRIT